MEKHPAYISLHFTLLPELQPLVLAYLQDLPFLGFEEGDSELVAYIEAIHFDPIALQNSLSRLEFPISYVQKEFAKKNWNKEWESNYNPVKIGSFCAIRSHFHAPIPDVQFELIIDPKMSFGTGHHETTQLVIRHMQQMDFQDKLVLEMGCGTGILGILAEKLGASSVLCMDVDTWCIENSLENCQLNQTEKVGVRLRSDDPDWTHQSFHTVIANINLNVLKQDIPLYAKCLKTGGELVLSGFYEKDIPELTEILQSCGLRKAKIHTNNKWTALLCRKIT